MKKSLAVILSVILVFGLSVAGCSKPADNGSGNASPTDVPGNDKTKIVVGVSQCTTQEERWRNDLNALEAVGAELGVEIKILDAANDPAKQSTDIENLVSSKVDAILISPTDANAIVPAITDAKKEGIPVVVWGRQVDSPDQDFFVINNFEQVGAEMGKIALQASPKGNYFLIGGDKSTSVPTDMTNGIMSVLQPSIDKGDIKITVEQYITNWDPNGALSAVENALTQTQDKVDLVICHNDGMAGGVIKALSEQNLNNVPVIGMDAEIAALQRLAEGKQYSTLLFDSVGFAEVAMNAAVNLAKGEPIDQYITRTTQIAMQDVKTGDIPFHIITLGNVKELILDAGLQKVEDVYKNVPMDQWPK
jgi:D-xylose transport system substrate-binding protein